MSPTVNLGSSQAGADPEIFLRGSPKSNEGNPFKKMYGTTNLQRKAWSKGEGGSGPPGPAPTPPSAPAKWRQTKFQHSPRPKMCTFPPPPKKKKEKKTTSVQTVNVLHSEVSLYL